jgi:hypothetical protein
MKTKKSKPPSIGRRPILVTPKGGYHTDKTQFLRCRDKHIEDNTYITQNNQELPQ